MPHLIVLGRPSGLAGDDLTIFLVFALAFKLVQVGLLVPLLYVLGRQYLIPQPEDCVNYDQQQLRRGWYWLVTYWSLSAALVVVTVILNYAMIRVSRRGTPSEPEKRSLLSQLCAFNLIGVTLLRILCVVSGIMSQVAVRNICSCQRQGNADNGAAAAAVATIINNQSTTAISVTWNSACQSEEFIAVVTLFRGLFVTHAIEASFAVFFYVWRFFDVLKPMARLLQRRHGPPTSPSKTGCWNWSLFCRMCCTCTSLLTCCLFGGLDAAFSDFVDLSTALEDFFDSGGILDVTISDIIAGLLMVYKEQTEEREECRQMFRRLGGRTESQQFTEAMASMKKQAAHYRPVFEILVSDDVSEQPWRGRGIAVDVETAPNVEVQEVIQERQKVFDTMILRRHRMSSERVFEPKPRFMLDPRIREDREAILEGAHFINLALAIYGHKLYNVNHAITGPPLLCAKSLLCCTYSCRERMKLGDLSGCYKNAFLLQAGLSAEDLVFATFREGIVRRPYCIVIDRSCNAVVVVIRGTLSLEDWVADFTIRPTSLDPGKQKYGYKLDGEYVHSGMFASAEWLYNDIAKRGILDRLVFDDDAHYKDFSLYVIGHSLGAGVAAVLSLLFRSKYPSHRCLLFEPPGCVFSEEAARNLDATSYIFNHDIIPRLSLHSMENLRNDILLMLARLKVSKDSVVLPTPFNCQRTEDRLMASKNMLHPFDEVPSSKLLQQLHNFNAYAEARRLERGGAFDVQLFPPAKIVHIVKSRGVRSRVSLYRKSEEHKSLYSAIWADNADFGEIELASSLVSDHDPNRIHILLNKLAETYSNQRVVQ